MDKHDIASQELINDLYLINPDSIVVDVGANYGIYTKFFLSRVNGSGHIYAIELEPGTFNYLSESLKNAGNLTLINCGVSNKSGFIDFYKHKNYHQMSRLTIGSEDNSNDYYLAGKINIDTLDNLLKDIQHISLIKIDIEGEEYNAIDGMVDVLKRTDVIFYENHTENAWDKVAPILTKNEFLIFNIEERSRIYPNQNRPYQTVCFKSKKFEELKSRNINHWIFN